MTTPLEQIKAWAPPAAGVLAVLLASIYAFAKKSSTEQVIYELNALGSNMSDIANTACAGLFTPTQVRTLEEQQKDLEVQIRECSSPARVQRDLTITMERVGVNIVEIKPEVGLRPGAVEANSPHPRLRVILEGDYRQIANFMDQCSKQRLPGRVIRFTLARPSAPPPGGEETLIRADITVETLKPVVNENKEREATAA